MTGLVYCVLFLFYIETNYPTFTENINNLLCSINEVFWIVIKIMRIISIFLLAFYRYLATFYINIFRLLNKSSTHFLTLIIFSWMFAIGLSFLIKYSFQTTYSIWFCTDGYSESITNSIGYYVVLLALNIALNVGVILIYLRILSKLKKFARKAKKFDKNINLNLENITQNEMVNVSSIFSLRHKDSRQVVIIESKRVSKEHSFAKQFIIINVFVVLGTIFSMLVNFSKVIAAHPYLMHLDKEFEMIRPILRIISLFLQSLIPILSLVSYPWSFNLKNLITFWKI